PPPRRPGEPEARPPAAAPVRRGRSAAPVSRMLACYLACWLACWGCRAASGRGVELLHRADDAAAQLEDLLLTPYRARHPGLQVVQHNVALSQAEYRSEEHTSELQSR